ncbi:MAG: membrane dipeptidase [Flavobacterium sp.]|jgi:membrane dipeptidase
MLFSILQSRRQRIVNLNHIYPDCKARLVELVGVDHVGLGTDMDGNFKPVFSRYLQMPNWRSGLIEKGFSDVEVSKIIGGNAQRLLTQVLR